MKNIPVLSVKARSLAEAYESALIALYREGIRFKTQYDKEGDLKSIDATMNITVEEPWKDPMIHKAFPGGIDDLREYVFELLGLKDHWVKNMNDPADTRWEYTYHQRLADWGTWKETGAREGETASVKRSIVEGNGTGINQIKKVVDKLVEQPFTRQAQMITWMPFMDFDVYDPPCLQSLWYRLLEDDGRFFLNCNVRFRSNDAWGANFMNMFGFVHFNRLLIADPIQEQLRRPVEIGRLNWHSDSYHIYGKDQKVFKERFWDRLEISSFEERVYNFHDEMIQEIWQEAEEKIKEKITRFDRARL
ncbi:MAG: thymidylate synthase [Spirochaetota bacterium]